VLSQVASFNVYAEDAKSFGDGSGDLFSERPAEVFKVARTHFVEHVYFFLLHSLQHVFVVE